MERILEPELMDDPVQALAYARADFSTADTAFVDGFLARFPDLGPGPILDIGCGPGNIALRLARALPDREVVGVDGADAMLDLAREAGADLDTRVRFVSARIPTDALPDRAFAAVVSNSLLHHLPDPAALWHAVARHGAPGAAVWIGDLRRPATPEDALALVRTYAADDPDVLRRDFHASLHAAFEPDEVRAQLRAAGLALEVVAVGDRHQWVWGRLPV